MITSSYTLTTPPDALKTQLTVTPAVAPGASQPAVNPPAASFTINAALTQVAWGDLPREGVPPYTASIFVYRVVDPVDPKQDEFLRVANVADMTALPTARPVAVNQVYRRASASLSYDSIVTAAAAKPLLFQRIDNLVADWRKYAYEFLGLQSPALHPPPSSNVEVVDVPLLEGIVEQRKADYEAASAAYDAAAAAATEAQEALEEAQTAHTVATADLAFCQSVKADNDVWAAAMLDSNMYQAAIDALRNAANTIGTIPTAVAAFDAARASYMSVGAPEANDVTNAINAQCLNKETAVQAATEALANATSEVALTANARDAALVVKDNARTAVLDVCPDFEG